MNYLITGATGFVGPHLIKRLTDEGHFCRCLVRDPEKAESIEGPNVEIAAGDITNPRSLAGIGEGMDVLLHMATLGHMSNFVQTEAMFEAVNLEGTVNIMTEASKAGIGRIVHCSTVAAMGICTDVPADEESPCNPHHPYGRSKLKAEKAVRDMVRESDLPAVIIRFSMVYGPKDGRDILKLTRLAKKGLFPRVGKRPKLTPLIHVSDAVEGLLLAAEKGRPGEIYLITNEKSEPFDRIRKILIDGLGVRRPPLYVPEWAALFIADLVEKSFTRAGKHPPVARKNIESTLADRVFSIEKAVRELGFSPKIDPEEGLKQTVSWYKENEWI